MQLQISENLSPGFLSYDNFYEDPDEVRRFALSLQFRENIQYHKGARTCESFAPPEIKDCFETLLNRKIENWNCRTYPNGVFQYCTAEDPIVYHMDKQTYAGVIYLTPDAPPECGTSFFRSKVNKIRRAPEDEKMMEGVFSRGFLDRTQFDLVDIVGNVYNRLVLWDAKMIHAASQYFGDRRENSRLFHLFFFDA